MSRPLNPKQLKFVERYLATGNATQSYIEAGYKARGHAAEATAANLLRNTAVKTAIESARAEANLNHGITADWYAKRVKLEAEREGKGASHAARVAALKLAGDLLGVGELHKHQHSGPNGQPIEHEHHLTLTAEDLDAADRLAPVEDRGVHPDGQQEQVHPAPATLQTAGVLAPG